MQGKEQKKTYPYKQKDIVGKDVYFDNGMKLGEVISIRDEKGIENFEIRADNEEHLKNYRIEVFGDGILSLPAEQFEMTEKGIIFQPIWRTSVIEKIEKIEEKLKVLDFEQPSAKNMIRIIDKESTDDFFGYGNYINDVRDINKIYYELLSRLANLEIEKLIIETETAKLQGKRLLKELSRREFAQEVYRQRKRAEICNLNIQYCEELIQRLEKHAYIMKEKYELEKIREKEIVSEIFIDAKSIVIKEEGEAKVRELREKLERQERELEFLRIQIKKMNEFIEGKIWKEEPETRKEEIRSDFVAKKEEEIKRLEPELRTKEEEEIKARAEEKTKYKCPKCSGVNLVASKERPLIIVCSSCGIKGVIKE